MSERSSTTLITDRQEEQPVDPRRWYALAVILLPTLLISLNTYMIQVALPSMQNNLNASFSEAQLIVTGFSLGLAVALIVSGKLGDLYGRKRMLIIGVCGFTVMAALCGLTSDPSLLIALRIVQGLTAALIQPQVLSMLQVNFLPKEKALAFGIYGALIGIGFAFGFILGGTIVNWNLLDLGWRTVFFFNVPFGILVLLLMPFLPESRARQAQSIDGIGTILLVIGLVLLVYPLSEGQQQGWPYWTWVCLGLSIAILSAFVWVEIRKAKQDASPLVDLSIFRHRSFSVGMTAAVVIYLSMFSFFFILSYYLQFGLHYNVQSTSFVFLPLGIGYCLSSLVSTRIVRRWGIIVMKLGTLAMGGCSLLLMGSLYMDAIHFLHVQNILLLWIYGLGLGMVTTPLVNIVLSVVPAQDAGAGSGLFTTSMYLANSLGVALIGMLFSFSLKHSLIEAKLSDYVRAFSTSLSATGGLAFAAFICLCLMRERNK
ncbi:MFS transporter [Paenibacillus sp. FSL H8-0034]|uniref:MFS transporter n=1 Tax=Paenibacillus sp. FSL H8-0034 TaxID=2954671 RepID=UPI0030FC6B47